jgi:hypothetical protein
MSHGANEALLVKAWKARNNLYEEMFGAHAYSLPKHYTPPAGSSPAGACEQANGEGKSPAGSDAAAIDCLVEDDGSVIVRNGDGSELVDMQPIRDLMSSLFTDMSSQRISILTYPPGEQRPYWLYLTAGLSNPWYQEEADEVSGFGCEFMVKSAKPALWPVRLLRRLAYYILSYSGTLSPGVILNLKDPITVARGVPADLKNLFIWYADEAPDCWYQLPSGGFGVFCAVGITEDECKFAESIEEYGTWGIQQVLRQTGVGQVTDPRRGSVMAQDDIDGILSSVRMYAENFKPTTM